MSVASRGTVPYSKTHLEVENRKPIIWKNKTAQSLINKSCLSDDLSSFQGGTFGWSETSGFN